MAYEVRVRHIDIFAYSWRLGDTSRRFTDGEVYRAK